MTDKGWSFVRASSVSSSRPFRLPPCRLSSGVLIPFLGRRVPNLEWMYNGSSQWKTWNSHIAVWAKPVCSLLSYLMPGLLFTWSCTVVASSSNIRQERGISCGSSRGQPRSTWSHTQGPTQPRAYFLGLAFPPVTFLLTHAQRYMPVAAMLLATFRTEEADIFGI